MFICCRACRAQRVWLRSDFGVKVTQPSWLFGSASIRACGGCKLGSLLDDIRQDARVTRSYARAGFFSDASLLTSAFVPFSRSMPHALRTARVGIQINRKPQIGTSRIRSPSQITYGWCVRYRPYEYSPTSPDNLAGELNSEINPAMPTISSMQHAPVAKSTKM